MPRPYQCRGPRLEVVMMVMTDVQLCGSFVGPREGHFILDMKIFPSCKNWVPWWFEILPDFLEAR